ncbi:thiol-disulfide oxidoreductase DCC family protein [Prochlorothrix hollandica]|uniref:Thiol-disulfide oxidoreductase n=1 Tax=Prochlorothrix hollandica PCC 9006 = CALU 1027 TaxID=317619 RepID=A0A0M2PTE1_PROHO|nr:DCC1-like thiol-disulfide oxidoreductase family protein [Prochlorothrix hollandica]KKI98417.1 thiol-disulfide oxidoreductase [Prochlorothrix hollandica PCC 9006 = CALU 1027]
MYHLIYDGNCNLCVTFTRLLETFDQGQLFHYVPMQDRTQLEQWGISGEDCALGMILVDETRDRRWQGSDAAEEIIRLLPLGSGFVAAYRLLPGAKWLGDRTYEQIRDNRYSWFGSRSQTYWSTCASRSTPPEP